MNRIAAIVFLVSCSVASAFELSGRVVDGEGRPVAGAIVWLSQGRAPSRVVTGETGAFSFDELKPGRVEVAAYESRHAVGGFVGELFDTATLDIRLMKPEVRQVRVIAEGGKPVAGVRVKRLAIDNVFDVFVEDLLGGGFPSVRSGEDGVLAVPYLPEGSVASLYLSHRNYCDLNGAVVPPGVDDMTLQMRPGIPLGGRVVNGDGAGIRGARVLGYASDDENTYLVSDTMSDSEGFYRLMLMPGNHVLEVSHPEYASPEPRRVSIEDIRSEKVEDLLLWPRHEVEGSVVGPRGGPVGGVWVSYLKGDYRQDVALTGADGVFRLGVSSGEGRVHVEAPAGYTLEDRQDVIVKIKSIEKTTMSPVRLAALPRIAGVVLDGEGAPAGGVLVKSLEVDPPLEAITNALGEFDIQLSQAPEGDSVRFRAEHPLRFLRCEFDAGLTSAEPLKVRLASFQPDLGSNDPARARNDMSPLVGEPAPEIQADGWINSEPLTIESLRGKVVVLTFWGGFDPYGKGRAGMDELVTLHSLLVGAEDVAFVGVHDDADDLETVAGYARDYGLEFPVCVDKPPLATFTLYDVRTVPQTVLIDKQGIVRYFDVEGRLLELIKDLRRQG